MALNMREWDQGRLQQTSALNPLSDTLLPNRGLRKGWGSGGASLLYHTPLRFSCVCVADCVSLLLSMHILDSASATYVPR